MNSRAKGRARGRARYGKALSTESEKSVFKFSCLPWQGDLGRDSEEDIWGRPQRKRLLNGDAWARNADIHKSMAGQWDLSTWFNSLQRLQCLGCAPTLVWVGQLFPMRPDRKSYCHCGWLGLNNHTSDFWPGVELLYLVNQYWLCMLYLDLCFHNPSYSVLYGKICGDQKSMLPQPSP